MGKTGVNGGGLGAKAHISLTTDALICKPCTRSLAAEHNQRVLFRGWCMERQQQQKDSRLPNRRWPAIQHKTVSRQCKQLCDVAQLHTLTMSAAM